MRESRNDRGLASVGTLVLRLLVIHAAATAGMYSVGQRLSAIGHVCSAYLIAASWKSKDLFVGCATRASMWSRMIRTPGSSTAYLTMMSTSVVLWTQRYLTHRTSRLLGYSASLRHTTRKASKS